MHQCEVTRVWFETWFAFLDVSMEASDASSMASSAIASMRIWVRLPMPMSSFSLRCLLSLSLSISLSGFVCPCWCQFFLFDVCDADVTQCAIKRWCQHLASMSALDVGSCARVGRCQLFVSMSAHFVGRCAAISWCQLFASMFPLHEASGKRDLLGASEWPTFPCAAREDLWRSDASHATPIQPSTDLVDALRDRSSVRKGVEGAPWSECGRCRQCQQTSCQHLDGQGSAGNRSQSLDRPSAIISSTNLKIMSPCMPISSHDSVSPAMSLQRRSANSGLEIRLAASGQTKLCKRRCHQRQWENTNDQSTTKSIWRHVAASLKTNQPHSWFT